MSFNRQLRRMACAAAASATLALGGLVGCDNAYDGDTNTAPGVNSRDSSTGSSPTETPGTDTGAGETGAAGISGGTGTETNSGGTSGTGASGAGGTSGTGGAGPGR